jgi:2-polyprenyl-6-methoxyphenol hydroxylase-like FAD-dependent oxidoreductase
LPERGADLHAYLEDYYARLPGGPQLRPEQRASTVVASVDYPLVRRDPLPVAGVALVGDAALTADPAPAPGCTWALLSGQWLADHVAAASASGSSLDEALRGYRRARRRLERELLLMRSDAASGRANPVQRLLREAAVHDPVTAERLLQVGMQVVPTTSLLRPDVLGRAWTVSRRSHRDRRRAAVGEAA